MLTLLILIIIYISFISLGMQYSLLGSAWPSISGFVNVPLHYAGYVSIIITGGMAIAAVLSGKIVRHFGTVTVIAASVLITASGLMFFSFSSTFFFICLCAIPLGLGAGSVDASLNNYVALHYKARYMSWLHCFWGVGASIGPIIMSSYLLHRNSWSLGYRTVSVIQFCLVLLLFFSIPLWEKNKIKNPVQHHSIKFTELFKIAGFKEAIVVFLCYSSIEVIAALWGASFMVTEKNIPREVAAKWIALFYIGMTSGRFISGFISIKLNNRQMIRLGQTVIGCGIVLLVLPLGNTMLLPGFFMIGLGCAPIYPSLLHQTPANFGKEYSQAMMGIQMGCSFLGATLFPLLFGQLASHISFKIFSISIGVLLIFNIIMVEVLNRKIDRKK